MLFLWLQKPCLLSDDGKWAFDELYIYPTQMIGYYPSRLRFRNAIHDVADNPPV